jgi:hypothetical protein
MANFTKKLKTILDSLQKNYLKPSNLTKYYMPICILLLVWSPILFLFCNSILLCILIYYCKINFWELFKMNVFLLIIWIFLFSCYMYLLTHEPSIPLYPGDSIILNPGNLVLIVSYSAKFPSIFRSTFLETIVILHLMSHVLGWYPTLFFFI